MKNTDRNMHSSLDKREEKGGSAREGRAQKYVITVEHDGSEQSQSTTRHVAAGKRQLTVVSVRERLCTRAMGR